jgi:hypothetical protein
MRLRLRELGFWFPRSLPCRAGRSGVATQSLKPGVYGVNNGPAEAEPFPNRFHASILGLTCGIMSPLNYKRGGIAITVFAALLWACLFVQANYLANCVFAPR